MYFFVKNNGLLEKCNTIWDKVSVDIKREFDSESVNNKEFLKTKMKYHGDEVTDFYDKKIPRVDSNHTCLAVINLDSVLKKDDNYYLQVFSKVFKNIEKKGIRHINYNLSDFSYSDESDEEQRLMIFERTILKMYFLSGKFQKSIF